MPQVRLEDPVVAVPGIGPARARELLAAGIETVDDLLLHLPLRYEDRSRVVAVSELIAGVDAGLVGTLRGSRRARGGRGRTRIESTLVDGSGEVSIVWFNQPYLADRLAGAETVHVYGRPAVHDGRLQIVNPVWEAVAAPAAVVDGVHLGRIVPVYRAVGNLGPGVIRRLVHGALAALAAEPGEPRLPAAAREAAGLMSFAEALAAVHAPPASVDLEALNTGRSEAHRRLVMQELIEFQTALALQRQLASRERGIARPLAPADCRRVETALGFDLTGSQRACVATIYQELRRAAPMHRLVQGDVGCGKTAVAACALLAVALGGEQGALLAPTEVLAEQHAHTLGRWGSAVGIRTVLLTGATPVQERRTIRDRLGAGEPIVVVGTHALLGPRVQFARLGLVVIDEQHRFGVGQRAQLRQKGRVRGRHPDLLVMTATPIPRSLALTLYGDLDVGQIDELPPGRAPVATTEVPGSAWDEVVGTIAETVAGGERVFVVVPRVELDDEVGSVEAMFAELEGRLPAARIGALHGALRSEEKLTTMRRFVAGELDVLVSTTVVEVGVDVPAATLMVIDHAERFGLAQLHQLRGRVGRGGRPGRCVLVARAPIAEVARRRLETLVGTTDGFRIAEEDLVLRGPGETLGTRQAGRFELRLGDPSECPDWLIEAHRVADAIVGSKADDAEAFRARLRQTWRRRLRLARAG